MRIVWILLFSFLFVGCTGTHYLSTSDMKEGVKSFVKGEGWGIVVATATFRSNAMVPVVFDTYHFSSIEVSPSSVVWPGGLVKLAYKVPARGYRSYSIDIGLTPIGRYQGRPIRSTTFNWSFSDADYHISHQLRIIEQSDSSCITLR